MGHGMDQRMPRTPVFNSGWAAHKHVPPPPA